MRVSVVTPLVTCTLVTTCKCPILWIPPWIPCPCIPHKLWYLCYLINSAGPACTSSKSAVSLLTIFDFVVDSTHPAPAAYSQGNGSGISESELVQIVDDFIAKFGHKAPVVIANSAHGTIQGVTNNDKIAGAVHRGRVHLFLSQIPNRTAAIRVLWHESLHYGLRHFLTRGQFISEMLDLCRNDMWVRTVFKSTFDNGTGLDTYWLVLDTWLDAFKTEDISIPVQRQHLQTLGREISVHAGDAFVNE